MKLKTVNRIFLICFCCVVILFLYSEGLFNKKAKTIPPMESNISLFNKVARIIQKDYVDKIDDPKNKFKRAYTRMLGTLDKNSTYLDPLNSENFKLFNTNNACSCGIYGFKVSQYFYITGILKKSPAEKGGLKPGYFIFSINNKKVSPLSFWQIFLSFYSKEPKEIKITVFKKFKEKTREVIIKSEKINNDCLITPVGKNILLIKLLRFDEANAKILEKNLSLTPGKDIILDLRNYSGGDFVSLKKIAHLLLNSKIELILKQKKSLKAFTLGENKRKKKKVIIIIDKSTIMYSELLAAILKTDGGKIIGAKTKGIAAELKQFMLGGTSSILLTTGFFFQNENKVSGQSVQPDVKLKRQEFVNILERAITLARK